MRKITQDIKSIDEINKIFTQKYNNINTAKAVSQGRSSTRCSRAAGIISSLLFYTTLLLLVAAAFLSGAGEGTRDIMGYSYANVLTTSMQSEIPKGSFVLVKRVDPVEIEIGDDITYMANENLSYTHRVIRIYENYEDSGMRGFETQGIENPMPDREIVYAGNVVGKVVWSVPELGLILSYLKNNLYIVIGMFVVLMVLSYTIKIFSQERRKR